MKIIQMDLIISIKVIMKIIQMKKMGLWELVSLLNN